MTKTIVLKQNAYFYCFLHTKRERVSFKVVLVAYNFYKPFVVLEVIFKSF